MRYYVTADTHGYYTCMENALRDAGFFEETEPHKLVLCGDLLDRGNEANRLIDLMLRLTEEERLIYILGNHEELLIRCLRQIERGGVFEIASGMSHHYTNGTWDTLLQISGMSETEGYKNPQELVRRVKVSPFYTGLLPACVDFHETENYIFTHGWIPCCAEELPSGTRYGYDGDWRVADDGKWSRARWRNGIDMACRYNITAPGKTVVCGHWHASYGHSVFEKKGSEFGCDAVFSPFYAPGIIALDACVAHSGTLNCIVIDD